MKKELKEKILSNKKIIKLQDNLTYIIVKWDALPIIHIDTMIKAGTFHEPLAKAGLADATIYLCTQGTPSRKATEIAKELDYTGAKISTISKEDASYLRLTFLKKHISKAIEIWSDILLNPVFPQEELNRWQIKTAAAIAQEKAEPSLIANKKFKKFLFNNCSYGNHPTESSIFSISQDDVKNFYCNYYKPNNSVISIIGDIEYKEAENIISKLLEKWNTNQIPANPIPNISTAKNFKFQLINKSDLNQTQIRYGYPTVARNTPYFFPLILMNYVLGGGGFSSRLMTEIRSKQGLTYGIASSFYLLKNAGLFYIQTFTKNENLLRMINEIKNQLFLLKNSYIEEAELNAAKSYFSGSFVQKFERPEKISEQILDVELYELGVDYLDLYKANINKVTIDEIQECIQKFIHTDHAKITILGNISHFQNDIKALGEVEIQNFNED